MADFEDANSPTWPEHDLRARSNLTDAIEGTIEHSERRQGVRAGRRGRRRCSSARAAGTCIDRHMQRRRRARSPARSSTSGSTSSTTRSACSSKGTAPLLLPARRWRATSRRGCGTTCSSTRRTRSASPRGTIRATVLIETIPAAFEMDEILYELREHSAGLNAGRWDYIFSFDQVFRERPGVRAPGPRKVTMTVPFMRAYTELLVQTCHKRGAHAMGGMAAFIPSRNDQEANEKAFAQVARRQEARGGRRLRRHLGRAPRLRAASRWRSSTRVLGDRPNQIDKQRHDVSVTADELLDAVLGRRRSTEAACARTSTSASSTSPPGCAATAPRGSTT